MAPLIVVTACFFLPISVFAAALTVSPPSGTFSAGKPFTVTIAIDPGTDSVNVAEAVLKYEKEALSVQSVSKDGSAFSLWTAEPAFDNSKGEVTLAGGSPVPFSSKKNVLAIVFKGMKEGSTTVSFSDGKILAADGKGTDVLSEKVGASFTIGPGTAPSPAKDAESPIAVELPPIPVVSSPTHPEPETWYKDNAVKFKWTVPRGVDNVRILLDTTPRSVPSISNNPPISEKEFPNVPDGTNYFHVMFHNKSGWGTPAHRQVQIDKTPPEKFVIEARADTPSPGDTTLSFPVIDKASGIDHYTISMDGASSTRLEVKDVPTKGYVAPPLSEGEHTVKIEAYDKVGNMTAAEATFTVAKPVAAANSAASDPVVVNQASPVPYWVSFVLLAILVFVIGTLYSERRRFAREKEQLKQESDETADKLGKVFTALRDEVEEQIHTLSAKPNLTDFEREILERLKEALDVSEEILEKEVEDVRKLLR